MYFKVKILLTKATFLGVLLSFSACSARHDFVTYRENMPQSILILPPLNESNEVVLPDIALTLIPEYVAESGYYAFPPLVVQDYFRSNGAPSAAEINEIPYQTLREVFGADAALKITIKKYSYRYFVLYAGWDYKIELSLISLKTGVELWKRRVHVEDAAGGSGNPVRSAINAAVHAAIASASNKQNIMVKLTNKALNVAIRNRRSGMLLGDRRPNKDLDKRGLVKKQ